MNNLYSQHRKKLPEAFKYYCPKLNNTLYASLHYAAKPCGKNKTATVGNINSIQKIFRQQCPRSSTVCPRNNIAHFTMSIATENSLERCTTMDALGMRHMHVLKWVLPPNSPFIS